MKLLPFLALIFLASCSPDNDDVFQPLTDSLGNGWTKVPMASTEIGKDIFFINNTHGFAVAGHSLFHSIDGGTTWQKVYQSRYELSSIAMGNTNNAVFIMEPEINLPAPNMVLVTRDGGAHFDSVAVADPGASDAFFINASTAYLVGTKTWKTTDAGVSWTNVSSFPPDPTGDHYKTIHFTDEQHGWITGTGIAKTINGGANWEAQSIAGLSSSFGNFGGSVFFPDANTGYIASSDSVAKTTNGGTSWTRIFKTSLVSYHDLHFLTPQAGYMTDGIYIQKTTDGGNTWVRDLRLGQTGLFSQLFELHFTDVSHGWAIGPSGFILRYEK